MKTYNLRKKHQKLNELSYITAEVLALLLIIAGILAIISLLFPNTFIQIAITISN